MSTDIDIKNYAGEIPDSVAENQQIAANTDLQSEDFPVQQEIVDQIKVETQDQPVDVNKKVDEALSKQELNFKALREEISRIKAEKDELAQNLMMIRANSAPKPSEAALESKMFKGMNDDDIPNVKDIRSAWEQRETEYLSRIEELQVMQRYPDYAEVLDKYTSPLVKEKPHLVEGIQGAKNKALFAYELGKMAQKATMTQPQRQNEAPTQLNHNAQKIVENARKPGTLSSAGGQGILSKADYYATMSDAEFMSFAQKNLDEI